MAFLKTDQLNLKVASLLFIGAGLLLFELLTPSLFLLNQQSINIDFQGHLAAHDDPQVFVSDIGASVTRHFTLVIQEQEWEVGPGQFFTAITVNESIPGPTLAAYPEETIELTLINELSTDFTFDVMNSSDLTRFPSLPGSLAILASQTTQDVTFTVPNGSAGTWVYRGGDEEIQRGLYGGFIVYDRDVPLPDHDIVIFMDSFAPPITNDDDYFATQNGHIYPYTPHYVFEEGEHIRYRVINIDYAGDVHTIHLHGHVWGDELGRNVDNELMFPGDAIDRDFIARHPGMWMYHCHIYDHIAAGMTGMLTVIPENYPGDPLDYVMMLMEDTPI